MATRSDPKKPKKTVTKLGRERARAKASKEKAAKDAAVARERAKKEKERARAAAARAKAKLERERARAKAAKVRKQTIEKMSPEKATGNVAESRAFDTFERMEDKVLELEARVEAYGDMPRPEDNGLSDAALDAKFASMEKNTDVENQLDDLRKQVGKGQASNG